jgi:uncharacterized membrane protein
VIVLATLGLLDSLYLAYTKLTHTAIVCADVGDCETVNNSRYSEIAGIPIALLGVGAYLFILVISAVENRFERDSVLPIGIQFGVALTGTIYSGYLTYLEVFVLHAICPYCVISAILISGVLILSILRLLEVEPHAL